jgi:hypothetical protein
MCTSNLDITTPLVVASEDWWIKIQTEWVRYIKPCLKTFLDLENPPPKRVKANCSLGKHLENLIKARDPKITYWLKKAFLSAPNDPEVLGAVRGWMNLLDLIGTMYLLHQGLQIEELPEEDDKWI